MIGQTLSHYRIIEQLGAGGMGVVYLAEDTVLGRKVAIKMLTDAGGPGREHFRIRFLREAQAASKLSHPNIATIHDYGETPDGRPFIVMEYVRGKTLGDLIEEQGLTIPRAIEIITDVAEALGEAHRNGLVHRDIKPSNVAVNDRGEVKVLDFGLAKQINGFVDADDSQAQSIQNTQTREGVIVGTPMYLSPEQAMGAPVDARSDLFSLGSVFYECLAGVPAFSGSSPMEICAKVIRDNPVPPSQFKQDLMEELDRIALKSLAKKPDNRYQTAGDLISDLNSIGPSMSNYHKMELTAPTISRSRVELSFAAISNVFSRPRLSVGYVLLGTLAVILAAIGMWVTARPKPHQPPAKAQRFYDQGEAAIREGAFYKASRFFQRSAEEDPQFALAHARLSETWTELDFIDKAQSELIQAQDLVRQQPALTELDSLRLQAITNTVTLDFVMAVEDHRKLVELVPELEKKYAYVDLGRAYEKNEETSKAVDCYREAINRDPNYAAAHLRMAVALRRIGKTSEALKAFDEAYRHFELSNNEIEGVTEVFYQRGILFNRKGEVRKAEEEFQQALKKSVALENQDQQIKTLLQLSNNAITAGDARQAQALSQQAMELAQASRMENLTTAGLIDIGNSYFLLGNFSEAESNFNQALRLATSYKGKRNEARALLSLASLRTHQSKPDEATQLVDRALDFYQRGGYRKETSQAYSILGHAYDQLGKYEEAVKAFEEVLKLAEQVGDPQQIASSHEGLGVVLNHQQNYPAALDHFDKQYRIVGTLQNKLVAGYALMNRGTMLWQLGRYDDAEKDLAAALLIANRKINESFKELLAWIRVSQAQMAISRRNWKVALQESRAAMKLAGSEFKAISVHAGIAMGLAQSLSGKTEEGRRSCEAAVLLARSLPDPLPLSHALLALAEATLAAGKAPTALLLAQEAQGRFAAAKQHPSEWRAWLIAARAASQLSDNVDRAQFVSQANETLSLLFERWPSESYWSYVARNDVRWMMDELNRLTD